MRKFTYLLAAVLMLGSAAGFSACGEKHARSRYTIDAEFFPDEQKLTAQMQACILNSSDVPWEALSFELWPNAYREGALHPPVSDLFAPAAYYAGKSYGGIEIGSVGGCESFCVAGEDENILSVVLSEPLYPDECALLDMQFEVTLPVMDHRLGIGEHAVNLANFYPILCTYGQEGFNEYVYSSNGDPFVSECADYDVSLSYPEEYKAAFTGVGAEQLSQGKKVLTMHAENVRDVAFVLGKEMKKLTAEADGKEVEYCYFNDNAPETALKAATDALGYFSRTFGEYAYPRYTVVQTDFPYGGMEYPALSMISCDLVAKDVPATIAHETAHQWWYAMVGSNQFEHAWQDEGLAEYSSALFLGNFPEYGDSYENFVSRSESGYRAFFSIRSQMNKEADTTMDRPLTAYSGEYEYRNIAYDKGVILFDRVRSVVGDNKFFSGLKNYVSACSGRVAPPEELIACFRRAGGTVEELFASFTEGKCVI